ncbi:unnamed protein product [Ixodes pacificus]
MQRSPEVVFAACRLLLHRFFTHATVRRQKTHLNCDVRKSGAVAVDTWHAPPPVLTVSFAAAVAGTLWSAGHAFRSSQLGKKLITPRERAFFLERPTGGFRSN